MWLTEQMQRLCSFPKKLKHVFEHCRMQTDPTGIIADSRAFIISVYLNIMFYRKHWGCWPCRPRCLPPLHLFFLCDLLLYILLGTLHHVRQTGSVTESCCSTFVRVTERLHWDCELTSPRWPPGRAVRLTKVTAEHLKYALHMENSPAVKWRKAQMRFIHLNKADNPTDMAGAEVLVRHRKKCRRQAEERREADRVTGKASQL